LYVSGALATGAHITCAFICAFTTIYAPALAVRGPDGSMGSALEGMYTERKLALRLYGGGLFLILVHGIFVLWARTRLAATLIGGAAFLGFLLFLGHKARSIQRRFHLPVEYRRVGSEQAAYHSVTRYGAAPHTSGKATAFAPSRPSDSHSVHLGAPGASSRAASEDLSEPLCDRKQLTTRPDLQTQSHSLAGPLRKRGGKVQSYWKLRYFALNNQSLQYYELEGELKQAYCLSDQPVRLQQGIGGELSFSLAIGAKVLHLQALNASDFDAWTSALQPHCTTPIPLFEHHRSSG